MRSAIAENSWGAKSTPESAHALDVWIVSSKVCFEKSNDFETVSSCCLQIVQNCSVCLLDKTGCYHPV